MIRVAWYTLVVLATLAVLALLWQFSIALVLFFLSLAIAAAFRPVIDGWVQRGMNRNLALLLTYLVIIGLIAGLFIAFSSPLINDIQKASDDFAANYEHIKSDWPRQGTLFQQSIVEQLPAPEDLYKALAGAQGMAALQAIFGVALNFFDLVGRIAIIVVLSMYWSVDQVRFERLWLSLLPVEHRSRARDIWRAIETEAGAYIRSEFIQSTLTGLALGLGFWAMGLKYPALLALLGALARLAPWFGVVFIVITAFSVGVAASTGLGLLAAGYTLSILIVLELAIQPRFFSKKRYNSLLIILIVISLAYAYGLVGLLLAGPLAVAIQILLLQLFQSPSLMITQDTSVEFSAIQDRLAKAHEMLDQVQDSPAHEISSLMERVQSLVDRAKDYFNLQGTESQ